MDKKKRFLVAVTGASCMPLAQIFLDMLSPFAEIYGIASRGAFQVMEAEQKEPLNMTGCARVLSNDDLAAGPASGSWWRNCEGMIIIPCSMTTLGAIACGLGQNLIQRAAQTVLKESGKLMLITRESPLSLIQLRNMCAVKEAGGVIMPFSPGFYFNPSTIKEMLEHFCQRIFDQLGVTHEGLTWGCDQKD